MAETTPTDLITRLPPSPSSSVLSLSALEDEPEEPGPKRVLGIRELRKFSHGGKNGKRSAGVQNKEIVVHSRPTDGTGKEGGGVGNFAREVTIRGWKMVGGKTWSDKAKVGAYVGQSPGFSDFALIRFVLAATS